METARQPLFQLKPTRFRGRIEQMLRGLGGGKFGLICYLIIVFIHLSHLPSNLLRCYLD